MTAKEMFEDLGFDLMVGDPHFKWYLTYKKPYAQIYVTFFKLSKTYEVYNARGNYTTAQVTPELHKAITQQMKELRWI